MEQLQIRAKGFIKQGKLQEDDLEQIIKEMKAEGQVKDCKKGSKETAADNEHKKVIEAVEEGLLQVHGIAPNTKQPGIFNYWARIAMASTTKLEERLKLLRQLTSKKN